MRTAFILLALVSGHAFAQVQGLPPPPAIPPATPPAMAPIPPAMPPGPAKKPASQNAESLAVPPAATQLGAATKPEEPVGRTWTTVEIALTAGTLCFTLVVLGLETLIILKAQRPWSPQSILRVFGLTLILAMSVLLIAAGYSKDQTAPVMGLLGVIAGYLLGNNDKSTASGA